jgi:hypothetical protein
MTVLVLTGQMLNDGDLALRKPISNLIDRRRRLPLAQRSD